MRRLLTAAVMLGSVLGAVSRGDAANILVNPGFETGELSPWFQDRVQSTGVDWHVTSSDAHSGTYSATNSGNMELRQDFAPIDTSLITEVSFWMRHPAGTDKPSSVTLFYGDNTNTPFTVFTSTTDWEFFDVTSHLEAGKTLVGFSVFGYFVLGGTGPFPTFLDDVVINAEPAVVPEPSTVVLAGLGALGLLGVIRRRRAA